MWFFAFVGLISLIPSISAFQIFNQTCSSYNMSSTNFTFELNKFNGTWYEIEGYNTDGACTFDQVTHINNTSHSTIIHSTKVGKHFINTTAVVEQKVEKNRLDVKIHNKTLEVIALWTDYQKSAAFWHCADGINGTSNQSIWILSSNKDSPKNAINWPHLKEVLNATGILHNNNTLTPIDHDYKTCGGQSGAGAIVFNIFASVLIILFNWLV